MPLNHPARPANHLLRTLARALMALTLATVLFGSIGVARAQATWIPSAPNDDYAPRHVWQWFNDCVWAAGEMLLDKWTHGEVRIHQARLRRLSGDRKGGSTLVDLARGMRIATGIRLRFSPGFGDPMTWWQLLDRLEHHGGAVLLGEYGRLPDYYTRWSPRFAARSRSPHAVYVQQYDRANARVWLMDPLAYGGYPGEWIDVDALRRFADFDGDLVAAAATPARHVPVTAPLSDRAYQLGRPNLAGSAIAASTIPVRVGLSIRAEFPSPAAHRFVAHWEPVFDADPRAASQSAARPRFAVDSRAPGSAPPADPVPVDTASPATRAGGGGFAAALPTPTIPGRYRLSLGLAEAGRPTVARSFAPFEIDVHAPFAASWRVPASLEVSAGRAFELRLDVTNVGIMDWRTRLTSGEAPTPAASQSPTLLVLTWRSAIGDDTVAARVPAQIAPGGTVHVRMGLVAPAEPGQWTLLGDIVNVEQGALSSSGAETPAIPVVVDPVVLEAEP